jgi:hypothetical protein
MIIMGPDRDRRIVAASQYADEEHRPGQSADQWTS